MRQTILTNIEQHQQTIELVKKECLGSILDTAQAIIRKIKAGGTVFFCGNGGSAADSQHLAAELIGRFKKERAPIASIALSTDTSVLTCVGNDYSFDEIFSRQVSALVRENDVLIGISTSGNSNNVINAVTQARTQKAITVGLIGGCGGELKRACDKTIIIPTTDTARIQEAHIMVGHILCELIEEELFCR